MSKLGCAIPLNLHLKDIGRINTFPENAFKFHPTEKILVQVCVVQVQTEINQDSGPKFNKSNNHCQSTATFQTILHSNPLQCFLKSMYVCHITISFYVQHAVFQKQKESCSS